MKAHDVTGYALTESHFHIVKDMNVEFFQLDNKNEHRSFIQKIKHRLDSYIFYGSCKRKPDVDRPTFYYITPYIPSYDMFMEIAAVKAEYDLQILLTDEGLASYLRSPYKINKAVSIEWGLKRTIKYIWDLSIESRWFWYRLTKAGMASEFLLLYKNEGKWKRNEVCIEAYKAVLSQDNYSDDFSYYENAVLISPSLLYEAHILKEHVDIDIYKEISKLLVKKGIRLVAKPHPREKQLEWYDELNCVLEKGSNVALESVLVHLNVLPKCIIGDSSTTLVTASILFGIKAISINKLIDKRYLRDIHFFDSFNNAFSDLLCVPETLEELKEIIEDGI